LFLPAFLVQSWIHKKIWTPIVRCLDRRTEGRASRDDPSAQAEALHEDLDRFRF
jgi:hypothetical protein